MSSEYYTLPQERDTTVSLHEVDATFVSQVGSVKTDNEDSLGYRQDGERLRVALADGHWGATAAAACTEHWLAHDEAFAKPKKTMKDLQQALARAYDTPNPSVEKTRTPEASILAIEIDEQRCMNVVSYGDCRLVVVRDGEAVYRGPLQPTWIGLFSSLGMCGRLSVETATQVESFWLRPRDVVALYTDGVDECVYETPTLNVVPFLSQDGSTSDMADALFAAIYDAGAEDNASIAIIRIR